MYYFDQFVVSRIYKKNIFIAPYQTNLIINGLFILQYAVFSKYIDYATFIMGTKKRLIMLIDKDFVKNPVRIENIKIHNEVSGIYYEYYDDRLDMAVIINIL